MQATIAQLFDQHQLGTVETCEEIQQGVENACYIINEQWVIRLHQHNPRYQTEAIVYAQLVQSLVPVPKVIIVDCSEQLVPQHYIITTRLKGQSAHPSARDLSPSKQVDLGLQIGQALASIHQFNYPVFGTLQANPADDILRTWWQVYQQMAQRQLAQLEEYTKTIDSHLIPTIRDIILSNKTLFHTVEQAVLLHGDYQLSNVLQANGQLTGIIDMEWAIAGDRAYDFATDYHWHKYSAGCADAIYQGYQQVSPLSIDDLQRIAIYRLIPMLADAIYAHKIGWLQGQGWHWSYENLKQHIAFI